jgi:hypothetical protein
MKDLIKNIEKRLNELQKNKKNCRDQFALGFFESEIKLLSDSLMSLKKIESCLVIINHCAQCSDDRFAANSDLINIKSREALGIELKF